MSVLFLYIWVKFRIFVNIKYFVMANGLNFTKDGIWWVSQPIVATGDTAIEVKCSSEFELMVEQSVTGTDWEAFMSVEQGRYRSVNILGVVAGTQLRVRTTAEPTYGNYV